MLRIAVIFEGTPFDRKGVFNAVHDRVRHLASAGDCQADVYCVHSWDTPFTRRIRKTPMISGKVPELEIDGIIYRMLWYDFSIADHLLVEKLHRRPFFFGRFVNGITGLFEGYDVISAHSFTGGLIAREVHEKTGIPYQVTWHGSDIHTHPWRNPLKLKHTHSVMKDASCNFFVSKALMACSERISTSARKEVLYNGVSDRFRRFPDEERSRLRTLYGLGKEEKVVAFVGSIVAVKNVFRLQPLFHEIRRLFGGDLKFWMVGDGKLRGEVEPMLLSDETIDVRFWGNIPPDDVPSVMNCIDVMVLPSLNEGLPLVCAEAIRCGASVVGSDAGGIAEVIGKDNVVPLDDAFVPAMAAKVVSMLENPVCQTVPDMMDWDRTAEKEYMSLKSCLSE